MIDELDNGCERERGKGDKSGEMEVNESKGEGKRVHESKGEKLGFHACEREIE